MAGHLLKGLCAVVFLLITIVALAGGCSHSHPTTEGATPASNTATAGSTEVSQVSKELIGKQITIRGKFLFGKMGPFILADNEEVYLIPRGSFTFGKPYSEMHGKLVTATSTLRFYQRPKDAPLTDKEGRIIDRGSDYFYFNLETTQLRLVGH